MTTWTSFGKTLLLSILLGGALTCQNALAQTNSLESIARQRIAQRYNLPLERLTMIYSTTSTYRLSNQTAYAFKALDTEAATLYTLTLDRNGEEVNPDHLSAAEQAAYHALYGKLEPELSEWVGRASASERKSVMIWVREPPGLPRITPPMPHSGVSQDAIERYFAQVRSLRESQVASVVCPIADRCRERGLSVRYARYVPVLYGDFSASEVRLLESWEEVDSIGLVREVVPFMDVARQAVRADVVEARGITGSGVEIAMVETGGRIATGFDDPNLDNPYLSGIVQEASCQQVEDHSTMVAGVIRSTHSSAPPELPVRGIAPDVALWAGGACGGGTSVVRELSEQAIKEWEARVVNLSWGLSPLTCNSNNNTLAFNDKFFDALVFSNRVTFSIAAGNGDNQVCGSSGYSVASPARGYNVIAVGAYDDQDSPGWSDDAMSTTSNWCDPISLHNDREKPEVVAPGIYLRTTLIASPWLHLASGCGQARCGVSGTSYAAPVITGIAALLIQRSRQLSSALEAWPEAIKAILMATAIHNIEGDTRLSECDGAGGVDAVSADDVVRGVNGNWGAKEYDCSSPSPDDVATMNLVTGQRVRVVIVWATDPGSNSYSGVSSKPSADLDLLIINSAGNNFVAQSVSYDNTYEIVDFQASGSGDYKIRVVRNNCETDYPPGYLAWAWWAEPPQ
jgi:subtilisin family serine protease